MSFQNDLGSWIFQRRALCDQHKGVVEPFYTYMFIYCYLLSATPFCVEAPEMFYGPQKIPLTFHQPPFPRGRVDKYWIFITGTIYPLS